MRITTRYGYLVDLLRRYPFKKEMNDRLLEIKCPIDESDFDDNWWIHGSKVSHDPLIQHILELEESDPTLQKYLRWYQVITEVVLDTKKSDFELIKNSFINSINSANVEMQLKGIEKNYGYNQIIQPFFARLEAKNEELIANHGKVTQKGPKFAEK